ncbi:MAG: CotH kinase family protein, partial [Limisphaerales bacterium]
NPHNYYLYRHQGTGRWSYIPWDLDVGFADRAFGRLPVLEGWNAAWPVPGGPPKPILEAIVTQPELLKRYRAIADGILEKHFKPKKLHRQFDELHALIRDDLAKDPFPSRRITNPNDKGYEDILNKLKQFTTKRYQLARRQLDQPGKRPKPHPGYRPKNHRDPAPGNAPNGPTGLKVVSASHNTIRLQWNDNAENEAGAPAANRIGDFATTSPAPVGAKLRLSMIWANPGRSIVIACTRCFSHRAAWPARSLPTRSRSPRKKGATNDPAKTRPSLWPTVDCACV